MQFLLSKLGFPQLRMGGAEYDPHDSADENDEDAELEKVVSAQLILKLWHGNV